MTNVQYLTPGELAKAWRVNPQKVRDWIDGGELDASNLGNGRIRPRYRILASDAMRFWRSRQRAQVAN